MSQFAKDERSQPEMNNPNHDSRDTRLSADCRALAQAADGSQNDLRERLRSLSPCLAPLTISTSCRLAP